MQAGFEIVAAFEHDSDAVITYMVNLCRWGEVEMHFADAAIRAKTEKKLEQLFSTATQRGLDLECVLPGTGWIAGQPRSMRGVSHIFIGDVRKFESDYVLEVCGLERGELDVIAGGPPCQGFSTAGKRNVADPRNNLVFEFARFICDLNPKAMVMEEVPNILNMVTPEGHNVIDKFTRILEDGGFGGFEAFQKSIDAQAGAMGLMRGGGTRKDRATKERGFAPDQAEADAHEVSQTDLFEAAE